MAEHKEIRVIGRRDGTGEERSSHPSSEPSGGKNATHRVPEGGGGQLAKRTGKVLFNPVLRDRNVLRKPS